MNFNDGMVLITGFLCFMVGIAMVPLINQYVHANVGFDLPAALIGVVNLILMLAIIYIHTQIIIYNQKRKTKSLSDGVESLFHSQNQDEEMKE